MLTSLILLAAAQTSVANGGVDEPPPYPAIALETLVIAATRTERPLFSTPAAVTRLDREEIQRGLPYSYQDILETVPGVMVQGGPRRIAEEPVIRGFADEQVVLRIDGSRMNFNKAHGGRFLLDPALVESIEVLRGAGSAIYGSGALGGAMLIETLNARDLTDNHDGTGLRLGTSYDSNGEQWQGMISAYGQYDALDMLASATWRDAGDDLEDGRGQAILASRDTVRNGLFKLGLQPDSEQRLELSLGHYDNTGDNPTNTNEAATASNLVDRDTERRDHRLRYQHKNIGPGDGSLTITAYRQRVDAIERRLADQRLDLTEHDTRGAELQHSIDLSEQDLRLTIGVEAYHDQQQGWRNAEPRPQFPTAEVDYRAGFAQAEWELPRGFQIIPGLRFDRFDYSTDGELPSRDESQTTPRLAIGWRPSDALYFWLEYAQAFRAPSLTELYADGVHFVVPLGPGQVVINEFVPTPQLASEHAEQWTAGARWRRDIGEGQLSLEATAWRSAVDDYVDQFVVFISGEPSFDPTTDTLIFPGITSNRNVDARLNGVEIMARFDHARGYAQLSATHLEGEQRGNDAPLVSLAPDNASLSAGIYALGGDLTVGGDWVLSQARDDLPENNLPTPGFGEVDLFLRYAPVEGLFANTEWRFAVENVFDKDYRLHGNAIHQPGRSVRISLNFDMQWLR